ncbi:uncharacterized protein LOC129741816 [Uranotaenia lowii]|uniref:uncharacterized protein LOC129741816 n=1 Tax=Uranotaenia lowii TaxID=190385 RepID=UPI002478A046|nr:uncharacterized protein LOC129741816 [Uranotaenia lowii]
MDVFALVTRLETFRAFLAVAGKRGMLIKHFDGKTAYLHGTVEEEIFMRQSPGYANPGKEKLVCKLRKSINGLKQSARCWNQALHKVLVAIGFNQCQSDMCLYIRRNDWGVIMLLIYVDDMLIGCTKEELINEVFDSMRKEFEVTNLGTVKHFLGHEFHRENGYYSLQLTGCIKTMIKQFGLEDCKPSNSIMDPGYVASDHPSPFFVDTYRYRSLIGALLYVAVNARPDVAASVSLLGRKVSAPTEMDWTAAKRVVRYLKGTMELRLRFESGKEWGLIGNSDSDWAGDHASRRSTTGFLFFYGSGPIAWASRRQSCVSLSSMEAEYMALSETCQELLWLRRLMADFGEDVSKATTIFEENQSCLSFVRA